MEGALKSTDQTRACFLESPKAVPASRSKKRGLDHGGARWSIVPEKLVPLDASQNVSTLKAALTTRTSAQSPHVHESRCWFTSPWRRGRRTSNPSFRPPRNGGLLKSGTLRKISAQVP